MKRYVAGLVVAILLPLLTGCSAYALGQVRQSFALGDYDRAMALLDERQEETLPYLFERGLVAHYADQFDVSNRAFDLAEQVSEDLYTRSLSRELASLLTSDKVRPYAGTRYERLLIHYYRALNYVYEQQEDDALVEIRRAGALVQMHADEDPNYKFAGAAFVAFLSGLLYEWAHEWNEAYISYRWAETAYERYEEAFDVPAPKGVGACLVRLSRRLGFDEEAGRHVERYGEPPIVPDGFGEFVLVYESGYSPHKVEENLILPILKVDAFADKAQLWVVADDLVSRRHMRDDIGYEDVDVEYLMRVAIPRYVSDRPVLREVEVRAAGDHRVGAVVEDLGRVTLATFEAEKGRILLRTVARGLLKYLAYRRAKEEGTLAGLLVNALNVATENADTRSWQSLPHYISIVRMPLAPGSHDITLAFRDERGLELRTVLIEDVPIQPGGMTFWNYRTFE